MKPIRIVVMVSGGNCQGVMTNASKRIARKIDVQLHDEDNLEAEGKSRDAIGRRYNKVLRENPEQLF